MVWPHWHYERWATIRCCKPRQVCSVVRKWVDDKQNVSVVGQINNQMFALKSHMSKDVFSRYPKECLLKTKIIHAHVGHLPKKHVTRDKIQPLGFQKVGRKNI